MLTQLSNQRAFMKRTIRPVLAHHSAVPYAGFVDLDVVGTTKIVPGMVASKTTGDQFRICNATTVPFGLFADYFNMGDPLKQNQTQMGVWVGGLSAVFEVLKGFATDETPLDPAIAWSASNTTAGGVDIFSDANGRLTTTDGGGPIVARLIEAVSDSKIKVQLHLIPGV